MLGGASSPCEQFRTHGWRDGDDGTAVPGRRSTPPVGSAKRTRWALSVWISERMAVRDRLDLPHWDPDPYEELLYRSEVPRAPLYRPPRGPWRRRRTRRVGARGSRRPPGGGERPGRSEVPPTPSATVTPGSGIPTGKHHTARGFQESWISARISAGGSQGDRTDPHQGRWRAAILRGFCELPATPACFPTTAFCAPAGIPGVTAGRTGDGEGAGGPGEASLEGDGPALGDGLGSKGWGGAPAAGPTASRRPPIAPSAAGSVRSGPGTLQRRRRPP